MRHYTAASCTTTATVTVAAAVSLKAYPAARLTGAYVKYCNESSELDWSVTARVDSWPFSSGITLAEVVASFHMRREVRPCKLSV